MMLFSLLVVDLVSIVALYVSAWIEICQTWPDWQAYVVALYVSAWIEIKNVAS